MSKPINSLTQKDRLIVQLMSEYRRNVQAIRKSGNRTQGVMKSLQVSRREFLRLINKYPQLEAAGFNRKDVD